MQVSATFWVQDQAALDAALAKRTDVEFDDEDGRWIWFREKGEQRTLLGRLQCIDDALVVVDAELSLLGRGDLDDDTTLPTGAFATENVAMCPLILGVRTSQAFAIDVRKRRERCFDGCKGCWSV